MDLPQLPKAIGGYALLLGLLLACVSTETQHPKPERTTALRSEAMRVCERARDSQCVSLLRKVERITPDDVDVVHKLAWANFSLGDVNAALAGAERTLELDPSEYRAHGLRGQAYLAREQYNEAIGAYEMALTVRPLDSTSLVALAELHALKKDWGKCLKFVSEAHDVLSAVPVDDLSLEHQEELVRTWMFRSKCDARRKEPGEDKLDDVAASLRKAGERSGYISLDPEQFSDFTREESATAHRVAVSVLQARPWGRAGRTVLFGLAAAGYAPAQVDYGVLSMKTPEIQENRFEAAGWFRFAADKGDPVARVNLGALLWRGWGVPADRVEAFSLFEKSAQQGNALAYFYLGLAYRDGVAGHSDPERSTSWLRRAAEEGVPSAKGLLGIALTREESSAGLQSEGIRWLRAAAEDNNRFGLSGLADAYWRGRGVPRDEVTAFELFRRAAAQGHGPAQLALAAFYGRGKGVPVDMMRAWGYTFLAEDWGVDTSEMHEILHRHSSSQQKSQGRAFADRWQHYHPPYAPEIDSYYLSPTPWPGEGR